MATAELKPVYLITGGDRPKIQRALRRLRDRIGEDGVELLSANETSAEEAVAACNSMGLLGGGRRLVIVEDVERWKAADAKVLAGYLAGPAPDTVLALVAGDLKKDSALGKACAKAGDVLVYDVAKRRLPEWVRQQFADRSVDVDVEAARLLVEIVGEDPEELASEVDKIATWAAGEAIGAREIELLAVPATGDTPAWVLSDAWGSRDVAGVLTACEAELDQGVEPFLIAVRLASQVALVRAAQALAEEGLGAKEIASRLKKHEFRVRKAMTHADRHSREELDAAVIRLARLDAALKGASRLSAELELERALVEITQAPEAAPARA